MILNKFLDTAGQKDWYVFEGEKSNDDFLFYGYITDGKGHLGSFSLKELGEKSTVVLATLFKPCPLSQIKVTE